MNVRGGSTILRAPRVPENYLSFTYAPYALRILVNKTLDL